MFNDNANSGAGETTNDFHSYAAVRKEAIDKQSDSSWRKREGNSNEKFVKSLERFKSSRLLFRRPPVSRTQPNLRPSPQGSARSSSNVRRNFFCVRKQAKGFLRFTRNLCRNSLKPQCALAGSSALNKQYWQWTYYTFMKFLREIFAQSKHVLLLIWFCLLTRSEKSIHCGRSFPFESTNHMTLKVHTAASSLNGMKWEEKSGLIWDWNSRTVACDSFRNRRGGNLSGLFTFSSFSAPHLEADLKKNAKEYFTPTSPDDEWWWLDKSFFYFNNKIFSYFHGIFVFRASCLEIISFLYFEDYAKRI